jgi:hypothetical protein
MAALWSFGRRAGSYQLAVDHNFLVDPMRAGIGEVGFQ